MVPKAAGQPRTLGGKAHAGSSSPASGINRIFLVLSHSPASGHTEDGNSLYFLVPFGKGIGFNSLQIQKARVGETRIQPVHRPGRRSTEQDEKGEAGTSAGDQVGSTWNTQPRRLSILFRGRVCHFPNVSMAECDHFLEISFTKCLLYDKSTTNSLSQLRKQSSSNKQRKSLCFPPHRTKPVDLLENYLCHFLCL